MALTLPTDTAHLRLETRQYELFNRPLGQGIPRRKIAITAIVGGVWLLLMAILGVSPLSKFGPMIYLVPPFLVVFFGCRTDESGRMNLLVWYDAILSRSPNRRRTIRNPLMTFGGYTPAPIRITTQTELRPRQHDHSLAPSQRRGKGEQQ